MGYCARDIAQIAAVAPSSEAQTTNGWRTSRAISLPASRCSAPSAHFNYGHTESGRAVAGAGARCRPAAGVFFLDGFFYTMFLY